MAPPPAEASSEEEENKSIVLDPGSGYMKCGFAGDESPRSVFKNMIGLPREDSVSLVGGSGGSSEDQVYVGEEAYANSGILKIEYAIKDGEVVNFSAFKICVNHAFSSELRVDPKEYKVLLTEAPSNPDANREKMFQVMFDDFQVAASNCQIQAVLSLYASGRTSGLVLDSGDGVTHLVPVYRGWGSKTGVKATRCAGKTVTIQTVWALGKYNGIQLENEPNGMEIGRDCKEAFVRVAFNFDDDMKKLKDDPNTHVSYEFKDGSTILVGEPQIEPAEVIYKPAKWGFNVVPLPELLDGSIKKVNIEVRKTMFGNTVLSGGTTCIEGYQGRLETEYKEIVPPNSVNDVKVSSPADRKYAVFLGGSILCSLASFQANWITREDWQEKGMDAANLKKLF